MRSNYLRNKLIDHVIGSPAYTRPATLYFALMTVAPTGAGGGTEIPFTFGYARKAIVNDTTFFSAAASGLSKSNTAGIEFAVASGGAWGSIGTPIVAVAIYDAPTGGNLLEYTNLGVSRVIPDGAILAFLAGQLTFQDAT